MAKVANAAGATFFTSISVDDLSNPRTPPHSLVIDAFAALRELPESKRLGLLGPRFLLRHPYGKRSDPISSFSFEEFTMADGLGGMLWGHPALLALTVLAGQNGKPNVNELPFHHFVDADGDSTALPCTERFMSSTAATELGRYGIKALMAHKGEPLVQLTGPDTVAGTFTAPAVVAGKSGGRIGVEMAVRSKLPDPAEASADRPSSKRAAAAESDDSDSSDSTDLDDLLADTSDDSSSSSSSSDSSSDSDEVDLDALLAGLGGDDTPAASDESSSSDADDLDALLASLNDDTPAETPAEAAASDSDTDAELEALLKSLG